jgi:hypothetical protein
MSYGCDGMYRCKIRIGIRGRLFIFKICRYGEISELVEIFEILLGYVYLV